MLGEVGVKCSRFLLLDVPDEIVEQRISGRRFDPVSGKIYHMQNKPPETEEMQRL